MVRNMVNAVRPQADQAIDGLVDEGLVGRGRHTANNGSAEQIAHPLPVVTGSHAGPPVGSQNDAHLDEDCHLGVQVLDGCVDSGAVGVELLDERDVDVVVARDPAPDRLGQS